MDECIMNFLAAVKKYSESYEVAYTSALSKEEINQMISAEVFQGTWGLSVKILLLGGSSCYFPVSKDTVCSVGDSVDLTKVTMIVCTRGFDASLINWPEADINKLKEEGKDVIVRISF